jgi:hypothetical protein
MLDESVVKNERLKSKFTGLFDIELEQEKIIIKINTSIIIGIGKRHSVTCWLR